MIVLKPTNIKIGKNFYRLRVGKEVPENILSFWKESKQLEELKKNGIIDEKVKATNIVNTNSKEEKKDDKQNYKNFNNEEKK